MAEKTKPSKRQLEIQLSKLEIVKTPKLRLEQYPVSARVAAELLYMAGFERGDLKGRVIDLGTGTGRLAIGAALMGAPQVVGVDSDPTALALAEKNAEFAGVSIVWVRSEIEEIDGRFNVAIMNPPYGTRSAHTDLRFLDKAVQLAEVAYSIHKSSTRSYVAKYLEKAGRTVDEVRSMRLDIPHLFDFHTRKWKSVNVDLCRIV